MFFHYSHLLLTSITHFYCSLLLLTFIAHFRYSFLLCFCNMILFEFSWLFGVKTFGHALVPTDCVESVFWEKSVANHTSWLAYGHGNRCCTSCRAIWCGQLFFYALSSLYSFWVSLYSSRVSLDSSRVSPDYFGGFLLFFEVYGFYMCFSHQTVAPSKFLKIFRWVPYRY